MAESIVGPWAADKLDRLGKYLGAYSTIMHAQRWCTGYHYIDAFAGPGEHEIRKSKSTKPNPAQQVLMEAATYSRKQDDQREFLAGSPRVALDVEHPFTFYVFVERSADRIAALEDLKGEYGASRQILIRKQDCTQYLDHSVARNPKINWKNERAIVFLDPFGMQVGWDSIALLAQTKAIEIFLNFPVGMAIQRLLLRQPEDFTDALRRRLDHYLGSPDWFPTVYRTRKTLFGEDVHEKVERSGAALLKWYRGRLRTIFSHVSKAALIRNTKGGHLYYLLLASHNKNGVKIANDILSAGETITG